MENKILHLWGLSHQNTPLEIREKIAFSNKEISSTINKLLKKKMFQEVVLLSTCNRTEFYIITNKDQEIKNKITIFVQSIKTKCPEIISDFIYYLKKEDAIRHLFRVASGLDSMILGEPQILSQVKKAYFIAKEAQSTALYLNRLFNDTIYIAKKVRTQTSIGEGSMSIAFAAVKLAQKIFKDLKEKKGLLIGTGEIGKLTAKNLRERSMGKIYLVNRTFSKAVRIANQLNATPLRWEKLAETLQLVDFIISSTEHNQYVITREMCLSAGLDKKTRPTLIIDIAVPRDIDPNVKDIEHIFLHDIDDLNHIVEAGSNKRKKSIPDAMKLIEHAVHQFTEWSQYLKIRPTLIALKDKFHTYVQSELNQSQKTMNSTQIQNLEKIMYRFVQKLLRDPAQKLKEYSNGHLDGDTRIDVVREIFNLKQTSNKNETK